MSFFSCPTCGAYGGTATVPIVGKGSHLRSKFHHAAAFIAAQLASGHTTTSTMTRSILYDLGIRVPYGPVTVGKTKGGRVVICDGYWAPADLVLVSRLGFVASMKRDTRGDLVREYHAAPPELRAAAAALIKLLLDAQGLFKFRGSRPPEAVKRAQDVVERVREILR